MSSVHLPVLYLEVLGGLAVHPGGTYVDCTAGAGGHTSGLLEKSEPNGRVLALDVDPKALDFVRQRLASWGEQLTLVQANFSRLNAVAHDHNFSQVDGILMDLGWSSMQLADESRGFSFRAGGPLDMRYDPTLPHTAGDLVNTLPEKDLANLIWQFGEERHSRKIARAIVRNRPVRTADRLAKIISQTTQRGHTRIHPATKTFLALRTYVNKEAEVLQTALPQAVALLRPGGRLAVISFHSLEDRVVKNFFRQEEKDCICPVEQLTCVCGHHAALRRITRKPLTPDAEELAINPRSRSAKLRIAEKLP